MNRHEALKKIALEVQSGALHFPTHAQAGFKLKQALDDPDCHVDAAARLVQADPLLAAQIVAIANSVAYNPSGREILDVKTAVSRLGFSTLRSIVMARVTRQIAGTSASPEVQQMTAQLWEHTTHVAALARVIAKRITGQTPEVAFFAGIVHEVGGFYLLARSADWPHLLDPVAVGSGDTVDEAREVEQGVCAAVLKRLEVPSAIVEAIEEYGRGYLAMPPRTLADTLMLADYLAPIASPLWKAKNTAPLAEQASLDLSIDDQTLSEILAESAGEVASLAAALRG